MVAKRITNNEIKVIYTELSNTFGFYRIRQGKAPFICLSNSLLDEGQEPVHRNVYRMLAELHNSIPTDSVYRLYPMRTYFEELVPDEEVNSNNGPDLTIVGRPMRQWNYMPVAKGLRVVS